MVAGLASCDNRPKIEGAWAGYVRNAVPGQTQEMNVTYDFGKDGKVASSYQVTVSEPLPQVDSLMAAYQINVSAIATMNGTWRYVDGEDDEVALNFDPSTLQVSVDPQAVEFRSNVITAQQDPVLDSIRPVVVDHYQKMITDAMSKGAMKVVLDDVKVKGELMEFEIGKMDYTFHKN